MPNERRKSPLSMESRVLSALSRASRPDLSMPLGRICSVLNSNPGSIRVALHRLHARGLVARTGRGASRTFWLTEAGTLALERASSQRPWARTSVVRGELGAYRVLETIRSPGLASADRVEVFLAEVVSTASRALNDSLAVGQPVVIKALPNDWLVAPAGWADPTERADYVRLVNENLESELPRLRRASRLDCVAATLDTGEERVPFGRQAARFLVQRFIEGRSLLDEFAASGESRRTLSASEWFDLAEDLTDAVRKVQAIDAFHRRIWPGTLFLHRSGPVFADLGEAAFAVDAPPPSDPAPAPSVDSRAFIAPELRGTFGAPSRRADLFSLGAVLYFVAAGRAPTFDGLADANSIRSAVELALRGTVADQNAGIAEVIGRCMVPANVRVQDAYTLLRDIRMFRAPRRTLDVYTVIPRLAHMTKAAGVDVFSALAQTEFARFEQRLEELQAGEVVASGGHERLVSRLCDYLSTLGPGDEYLAVTIPEFWSPTNLGVRGRYLAMNLEIVRRGAHVLRVFLLNSGTRATSEVRQVIEAHRDLERRLRALEREYPHSVKGSLELRCLEVDADERRRVVNNGDQMGLWIRGASMVSVRPQYNEATMSIKNIRIARMTGDVAKVKSAWFSNYWGRATTIEQPSGG